MENMGVKQPKEIGCFFDAIKGNKARCTKMILKSVEYVKNNKKKKNKEYENVKITTWKRK